MTLSTRSSTTARALLLLLLAALAACGSSTRTRLIKVTSYPPGATIFVENVEKGTTPNDRVAVPLGTENAAELRVEMKGHQSDGVVVTPASPTKISFVLAKAPRDEDVLGKLEGLSHAMDRTNQTLNQIKRLLEEQGK